jgi:hypothetical protein
MQSDIGIGSAVDILEKGFLEELGKGRLGKAWKNLERPGIVLPQHTL